MSPTRWGILSAALMLDFFGLVDQARALEAAVERAVAERQGPVDIGGSLGTRETGDYIARVIREV
jgi:isocitrate/isopropylmalate dehydrogenase